MGSFAKAGAVMKKRPRPRVLALHCAGANPAMWKHVAAAAAEIDLLAPDLMAIARAVEGRRDGLVDVLGALLSEEPTAIVGVATGANLGVQLAARFPQRVSGVLLLNPHPLSPTQVFRDRLRNLLLALQSSMSVDERRAWAALLVHRGNPGFDAACETAQQIIEAAWPESAHPHVLEAFATVDTQA